MDDDGDYNCSINYNELEIISSKVWRESREVTYNI